MSKINGMRVIKRDGRITEFNPSKIIHAVSKAMLSIGDVDEELAISIAGEVAVYLNGAKEVSVEEIQDNVEKVLYNNSNFALTKAYMLYRHDRAGIRDIREVLGVPDDELKLGVNTLALLGERYLKNTSDGQKETPAHMFRRIARHVASVEKSYGNDTYKWTKAFYNLMANQYFLPNTPCIANAGNKDLNYLFACYAFEVGDSMEGIFRTVLDSAIVQKTGGGVGLNFSNVRPSGDEVKTTEGIASGPISFMRVFNVSSDVIKQGGIRRGGNLGLLLVSHPDIINFIDCKTIEGDFSNFNISVAITDDFMKAVKNDSEFSLINPKTKKVTRRVNARNLFSTICEHAWNNGEPGIVFWDIIEKDNPTPNKGHLIKNLCGEQDLLPYEACCLGSINLAKFVDDGKIVYKSLGNVVKTAVRFLDDVIDVSNYPLPEIEEIVKSNRKIGLGVMGFADMLFELGIPYNSDEGLNIAEEVMDFINVEAINTSRELAEDRGNFPAITDSVVEAPMRNATITTIAPTGSISIIAETSCGIEPIYGIVFQRENILGGTTKFLDVNRVFEEVGKKEGWFNYDLVNKIIGNSGKVTGLSEVPEKWQRVFVTALEVSPEWHIKMQAAFQRHIQNSISKTINMPYSSTVNDVKKAIKLAYDMNLKGLTLYRDKSRTEQVMRGDAICLECEDNVCTL